MQINSSQLYTDLYAMKAWLLVFLIGICALSLTTAQDTRTYETVRIDASTLEMDGLPSEDLWNSLDWHSNFTQYQPFENRRPSQKTEFAIAYDDNYVYVAFKAWDSAPDSINQRLTRRDEIDGDLVGIQFDSYYDQRTSFSFVVSAAGVKLDFLVSNDGEQEDNSWNPNWWVKTARDHRGWYAEMKIPFTQLRFKVEKESVWGIQVARLIFRYDEMNLWQPASRTRDGWVSQYGTLTGLKDLRVKRPFEVSPYLVLRSDHFQKNEQDPFLRKGYRNMMDAGVDGKIGLTNNFTLDFSINPDFGQVEADPSQVNLTTQEVFFREQRPLFIEGKNIFNFPLLFGDGNIGSENLFYSRRIGRHPQYYPHVNNGEYMNHDKFTTILGAAKLTGKTQNGWSIGILESITAEEKAEIKNSEGDGHEVTVEPLTNYFVSRVQKDFNQGNTTLGGIFSSVNRSIDEPHLEFLHKSALSGGFDFNHKFKDRTYQFTLTNYFSRVSGTPEALERTQRSFVRNYQRPDQDHKLLDPDRTELTGFGGKALFSKISGNLNFMAALAWKSPGLAINDVGFMPSTDVIFEVLWIGYRINEPFSIFRRVGINFNQWHAWNFGWENLGPGGNINAHAQLKNQWFIGGNYSINGEQIYTTALRGGPALLIPQTRHQYFFVSTADQKKISARLSLSRSRSKEKTYQKRNSYEARINYQPTKSLRASLSANFLSSLSELQYVTQVKETPDTRYLFGTIDQKVLSFSLRLNYNITPDLTIQYWGQPFVAAGLYDDYKYISEPRADHYPDRFTSFHDHEIELNEDTYQVYEQSGQRSTYSFGNPDFNVKEFLSNLVVRWEYQPGSTVFVVWSQSRSDYLNQGMFDFNQDLNNLFQVPSDNVYLIKFTHRLGR